MRQTAMFPEATTQDPRTLPVLGEQKDIRYLAVGARSVLNRPEATGMGYWSVNPYVGCAFGCGYCYARFAHRYAMERREAPSDGLPSWLAFERRVLVKENAPALVRRALRHGSTRHLGLVRGETLVIGTATDPYQPAERRFRVTRGILEAIAEHPGLRVVIITKSPLVSRDADVLRRIARHGAVTVHVSLITADRDLARRIEPRAPTPEARLRGIARLRESGIDVGVNVMPVLPGLTDLPEALDRLVRRIAEAGATSAGACALRLRADARRRWLPLVEREFPHLAARYRVAYARGHHVGERYREGLARVFARLCARHGLRCRTYDDEQDDAGDAPAAQALQLSLPL